MKNEPKQPIEPIFYAACNHAAGAEREAYLNGACGADANLRGRVEALLAAHDEASEFLEAPAISGTREAAGSTIGSYKLLQEIGEGGMGVVYMAEQEKPVRRKVALKVIKLGMDTKQVIARFEAERQALAMMDHANIARVFDAGSTATGRPYFVMELVRGVPIDEYCDTHKLETAERLALFVDVCRAVQHAHQKGIIHRDLKPTNVLVTSHDGVPVPKIIDFGVAKATHQRLTERTLFTEFQQMIGTPEYMSPEQAEMSGLDVDTRSDIYSLGVLLYQLLTGTTPVDATDLRTAGFQEMTRIIREDEPQAPSTRISKLGELGDRIAKNQRSDTHSLSKHLRGDLDWIIMKALEKDRTRRYETASAFAQDISRHLQDRPVDAGPPGAWYRLTKFAHRNYRAMLASLALIVAVGLGLAGTSAGFLRARAEAARSGRISESLQEVLAMTNAGGTAQYAEVEAVLATVRENFGQEHGTYAAVLDTLARRLHDGGDFERAAGLCRESLLVLRRIHPGPHPNVANSLALLGSVLRAQGEVEEAEAALRESLAIFEEVADGPGLAGYDARVSLADLLANRGEYKEADQWFAESLALLDASPVPSQFRKLTTLEKRYFVQINASFPEARATIEEIYHESREFYPEDSPMRAITAMGFGRHLAMHGELQEAEPYVREAVTRFRASKRPPGMLFFGTCDTLFQIIRSRTDEASVLEADDLLRDVIAAGRTFLGADTLASNQRYYASRMLDRGRYEDALVAMLDGHQVLVDGGVSFADREDLRDSLTKLAFEIAYHSDLEAGVYDLALEAAEVALHEEPGHPAMTVAVGAVLYRQGEFDLALETLTAVPPLLQVSGGLAKRLVPNDHAYRAMAYAQLGQRSAARLELEALQKASKRADGGRSALALLREAEALIESTSSSAEDD